MNLLARFRGQIEGVSLSACVRVGARVGGQKECEHVGVDEMSERRPVSLLSRFYGAGSACSLLVCSGFMKAGAWSRARRP